MEKIDQERFLKAAFRFKQATGARDDETVEVYCQARRAGVQEKDLLHGAPINEDERAMALTQAERLKVLLP